MTREMAVRILGEVLRRHGRCSDKDVSALVDEAVSQGEHFDELVGMAVAMTVPTRDEAEKLLSGQDCEKALKWYYIWEG